MRMCDGMIFTCLIISQSSFTEVFTDSLSFPGGCDERPTGHEMGHRLSFRQPAAFQPQVVNQIGVDTLSKCTLQLIFCFTELKSFAFTAQATVDPSVLHAWLAGSRMDTLVQPRSMQSTVTLVPMWSHHGRSRMFMAKVSHQLDSGMCQTESNC